MRRRIGTVIGVLLSCLWLAPTTAAAQVFEDPQVRLRVSPRTPQQIAAFYEARGFPKPMIERLRQVCFLTVGIRNKSREILWHDLADWRFSVDGRPVSRFDRDYWKSQWQAMAMPMASQSTFRWTLLPERLDFRPQEAEGGNITLPRQPGRYTLHARFRIGDPAQGQVKDIELKDVKCADE